MVAIGRAITEHYATVQTHTVEDGLGEVFLVQDIVPEACR
jgi:hypothetical protein